MCGENVGKIITFVTQYKLDVIKVTFIVKKAAKRYDIDSKATIYIRLRDGRRLDSVAPTQLSVNANLWDDEDEQVKSKVVCSDEIRNEINEGVRSLKTFIEKEYRTCDKEEITKDWLKTSLDKFYNPQKYELPEEVIRKFTFRELIDDFLLKHKVSEVRKKNFRVIKRALLRYELYVRETKRGQKSFELDIDTVTSSILWDIWDFFENEHLYFKQYPSIYEQIPEKRTPKPRGKNTLLDNFTRMRTFFNWCYNNKRTTNKPFDEFPIEECTYGSPIYINLEERDKIFDADLSTHPQLEIQRDIFIFQSLIGCRVGDLYRMTKLNVISNAIEYIPRKTKDGKPITVRVPLNEKGQYILNKYKDYEGEPLFPFTFEQKYNEDIKEIFRLVGINRIVTMLDPLTNEEVKVPICDIASSHMARRTFIGNIYKKVKDPNLIGALSGHKEGSKAFKRYREIDEDIKKELIDILS